MFCFCEGYFFNILFTYINISMIISETQRKNLEKKGYRFAGEHAHAANKICHWTRKSIVDEGLWY